MKDIYIIGGANIDIIGNSLQPIKLYDSNPSKIKFSHGGVGRNISENCALLKEKVKFISVFSDDVFGESIRKHLIDINVDITLSKIVYFPSSVYIATLDENNDMYIGMSDMTILSNLDYDMIDEVLNKCDCDDILVIDTNLDKKTIDYICKNNKNAKLCLDPISSIKALKIKDVLNYIDILKPNKIEAEILSGINIIDNKSANKSIDYFLNEGIKEIVISMSSQGVIVANNNARYWIKHDSIEVENATGGGDSFLAAYIHARNSGKCIKESAIYAIGSAVCTIKCVDTVNSELCDEMIYNEIDKINVRSESICI